MMDNGLQTPELSVVVAIVSDTTESHSKVVHLAGCLDALKRQVAPPAMEIIVPYHPRVRGIDGLRHRFPAVNFILINDLKTYTGQGGSREHHDELRARGLAAARGKIIGLIEDHARPDPHWCAQVAKAHQQDYVVIGGAIENGIDRPLNWAVFYCDFFRYQNPVPEAESLFVSDANATYKRSALESIRPVWQEVFHETAVNQALTSRGEKLALSPHPIVYQYRSSLKLGSALRERFIWGRSYAATRSKLLGTGKRTIYAALSPALPPMLLLRMALTVMKKGRHIGTFLKTLPLTAMLTASWSLGEFTGYLANRSDRSSGASPETTCEPPLTQS
jgi:hypothetical protein